jgi:hypothetical protein
MRQVIIGRWLQWLNLHHVSNGHCLTEQFFTHGDISITLESAIVDFDKLAAERVVDNFYCTAPGWFLSHSLYAKPSQNGHL